MKNKRILSLFLALIMIIGVLPITALAETLENQPENQEVKPKILVDPETDLPEKGYIRITFNGDSSDGTKGTINGKNIKTFDVKEGTTWNDEELREAMPDEAAAQKDEKTDIVKRFNGWNPAVPTEGTVSARTFVATYYLDREPTNIEKELNWDKQNLDTSAADIYWPLNQFTGNPNLPKQKIIKVGQSDPFKVPGLTYDGHYYNGDGRLTFRLQYSLNSTAVSSYWKMLLLRFDKEIYQNMDKAKSRSYNSFNGDIHYLADSPAEYEQKLMLNPGVLNAFSTVVHTVAIDIVMNDKVILERDYNEETMAGQGYTVLPARDYYVQSRLTDDKGERVFAYAPRGAAVDYTTYTNATILPFGTNVAGIFPTEMFQDTYAVRGKTFTVEYDPFFGENTIGEKPTTGALRTQYMTRTNLSGSDSSGYKIKGEPIGYMIGFDKKLLEHVVLNDVNPDQTIIATMRSLNDKKKQVAAASEVIKFDDIVLKGDTAFIVLADKHLDLDLGALGYTNANALLNERTNSKGQKFGDLLKQETDNPKAKYEAKPAKTVKLAKFSDLVSAGIDFTRFLEIQFKLDNESLIKEFDTKGKGNYESFGVVAGYIQKNSGWSEFTHTLEKDLVIPAGEKLEIAFSDSLSGDQYQKQVIFQAGTKGGELQRSGMGYYSTIYTKRDRTENFTWQGSEHRKQFVRTYYGQTLRKGDTVKVGIPYGGDYKGQVLLWKPVWSTDGKAGDDQNMGLTDKNEYLKMTFGLRRQDVESAKLYYTPNDGTHEEKVVNVTKWGLASWESDNTDILGYSSGTFTIHYDKIDTTKDVRIEVSYPDHSKKVTTIRNEGFVLEKSPKQNVTPYFAQNAKKVGDFTIQRAMYVPKQEIFTNDYSGFGTVTNTRDKEFNTIITNPEDKDFDFTKQKELKDRFESFDPMTQNLENFDKDRKDVYGYSLYPSGVITKMYVPRTGDILKAWGMAYEDEIDDRSESTAGNVITDMSTQMAFKGETHHTWMYKMPIPEKLSLKKDLKLFFSNTDSSSIPSNWKVERVRTRVLFDLNKDENFTVEAGSANNHIVKIVPDNDKYAQDYGYTPNGFVGENVRLLNEDDSPLSPQDKLLRTFPEDPKDIKVENQDKEFIGWSTKKGVTAEEFEKLTELTKAEEWATADSTGYKFTENSPVTTHKIVYAVYKPVEKIAVEFIADPAEGGSLEGEVSYTEKRVGKNFKDQGITIPKATANTDYVFMGWKNQGEKIDLSEEILIQADLKDNEGTEIPEDEQTKMTLVAAYKSKVKDDNTDEDPDYVEVKINSGKNGSFESSKEIIKYALKGHATNGDVFQKAGLGLDGTGITTASGYSFEKYTDRASKEVKAETVITENQVYTAQYRSLLGNPEQKYDQANDMQTIEGSASGSEDNIIATLVNENGESILTKSNSTITGIVENEKYKIDLTNLSPADKANLHGQKIFIKLSDQADKSAEPVTLDLEAPELALTLEADSFNYMVRLKGTVTDSDSGVLIVKDSNTDEDIAFEEDGGILIDKPLKGEEKSIFAIAIDKMGNKSEVMKLKIEAIKEDLPLSIRRARAGQGYIIVKSNQGVLLNIKVINSQGKTVKEMSNDLKDNDYNKIDLDYKLESGDRIVVEASKEGFGNKVISTIAR